MRQQRQKPPKQLQGNRLKPRQADQQSRLKIKIIQGQRNGNYRHKVLTHLGRRTLKIQKVFRGTT